jgi:hypothetical protein
VVAEYRRQIRHLRSPQLSLDLGPVHSAKGGASVSGRYLVTAENMAAEGGRIDIHVVKVQATLLIDRITLEPSG